MKTELIVQRDPKSPISEVFRTLRTNIQFANSRKPLKTLLVTSTMPEEGKTWVSANLAITFAQAGKKVVIIDADMRKGRLHKIFKMLAVPGLSNYLSKIDMSESTQNNSILRYVQQTGIDNLYIIPAGNIPPNPSELLSSDLTSEMLEDLKLTFDIIILDGTPSLLVTDAVILSRIVDSTILVAEYKKTKKDSLIEVKKLIGNVGGRISGVVLNKIPVNAKKYESTYYYSSSLEGRGNNSMKKTELKMNEKISKEKSNEIMEQLDEFLKNHKDNNDL